MKGKKVTLLRFLLLGCIVLSGIVVFSADSQAVPAFMRKYRTACTTCHWATFPKLNAFGRQFRNNGYRIPVGDEAFVKDEPVVLGARPWKKLFPNGVWPGDTPGLPPIGIEMKSEFIYRIDKTSPGFDVSSDDSPFNSIAKLGNKVDTDLSGISELRLNTGGTFGDTISFFGVFTLLENDQAANKFTHFAGIERAFVQYSPYVFEEQGLVNVRVGQFETRAVPFPFHRDIDRITFPFVNNQVMFESGNYFGMSPNQRGVEFFGAKDGPGGKGGLEWAVGVVNGDLGPVVEQVLKRGGFTEGTPQFKVMSREHDTFDYNSDKDYYARLSWKFGGAGVLGHEEETEELKLTKNWQDNSIKIGVTYYGGTAGSFMANPVVGPVIANSIGTVGGPPIKLDNVNFKRFGADFDAFWGNFNFKGQLMFAEDNVRDTILEVADLTPSGPPGVPDTIVRRGGQRFKYRNTHFAVEWVAKPWLIPAFRFQRVDFIDNPTVTGGLLSREVAGVGRVSSVQNASLDVTVLLRPNMKLLMGYTVTDKPPGAKTGPLAGSGSFRTPGVIADIFRFGLDFSL
ncbi:MAG: hypothetical protein ACE5GU_04855 [Candidatus Scalinduaceae bacterium]